MTAMFSPQNCPVCDDHLNGQSLVCLRCGNDAFDDPRLFDQEGQELYGGRLDQKRRIWQAASSEMKGRSEEVRREQAVIISIKEAVAAHECIKRDLARKLAEERAETEKLQHRVSDLSKQLEKTGFIERANNGQMIEWLRHLLSDVTSAQGLKALNFEPTLHNISAFADRRLIMNRNDQQGISWAWGIWGRVEARRYGAGGVAATTVYHRPKTSFISWREAPYAEAIELTPFDASDKPGVTIRIERPSTPDKIGIEFTRSTSAVKVQLPNYIPFTETYVGLFVICGNSFKAKGNRNVFNADGQITISLTTFRGVIAIIQRTNGDHWKLLDCREYKDGLLHDGIDESGRTGRNEVQWNDIRTLVEGEDEDGASDHPPELRKWLAQWPARSRTNLEYLYEQARGLLQLEPTLAFHLLQRSPKGLQRAIVLLNCGLAFSVSNRELIAQLDYGKFRESLGGFVPTLSKALTMLSSSEEKQWAIRHAHDQHLVEAAQWAHTHGTRALDRALALTPLRAQAKEFDARLRSARGDEREISELLARIEEAPWNDIPLDQLRAQLIEIEQRAGERGAGT